MAHKWLKWLMHWSAGIGSKTAQLARGFDGSSASDGVERLTRGETLASRDCETIFGFSRVTLHPRIFGP